MSLIKSKPLIYFQNTFINQLNKKQLVPNHQMSNNYLLYIDI
jgi:hypothetical protein